VSRGTRLKNLVDLFLGLVILLLAFVLTS